MDVRVGTPPFSLGSEVTYRCDEALFPLDVRTSTCTDVGGRGEWVENPGSLVCRESPGEMYSCLLFSVNVYTQNEGLLVYTILLHGLSRIYFSLGAKIIVVYTESLSDRSYTIS